jgi:hypothetical protein
MSGLGGVDNSDEPASHIAPPLLRLPMPLTNTNPRSIASMDGVGPAGRIRRIEEPTTLGLLDDGK